MANDLKTAVVEAKLDGASWTDITADVIISRGVSLGYGISGHGPMDRLAGSGQMSFVLNNSAENSGSLIGYYTPGHANARTGFELNLPVRLRLDAGEYYGVPLYGDGSYYGGSLVKFIGKISNIKVIPGDNRERLTMVECQDFIWEMQKHKMDLLGVQTSRRSDLVFGDVIGNMTESPESTNYGVGQETFPYMGDDLKDEKSTAMAAAQKIVASEFGYAYLKGGGELVFENRHARVGASSLFALDGSEVTINPIERGFDLVFNVIKATSFPREVGASPETLYTLQRIMEIGANTTETFTARYTDPDSRSSRIGGDSMITPDVSTDYKFGSTGDGASEDKNADLTVTVTFGANAAEVSLENTSGAGGFVNLFRFRGTALRIYDPIQIELSDATSQAAYGKRELQMQFPYQENHLTVTDFANTTLSNYKNPQFVIPGVGVVGKEGLKAALAVGLEPGDMITLTDDVGNIEGDWFVQSVSFNLLPNNVVRAQWSIVDANTTAAWILGRTGFSEIGTATQLGT